MSTELPKTSKPAARAFEAAGITSLEEAANTGIAGLQQLHGVGPKVLRILQEEAEKLGITFAD